jgi:hypothetical protein
MAGYGGLGGLGGFSYPTRRAMGTMPQSGMVQSDQEFDNDWQSRLAILAANNARDAFSDPAISGQANADLKSAWIAGNPYSDPNALAAQWDYAQSKGVALSAGQRDNGAAFGIGVNPYTSQGADVARSLGASHMVAAEGGGTGYAELAQQYADASQARTENQTRQQQAYNTQLMGNNAIGGVMPAGYSNANFGQVTGQKSGGLGGLGGADLTSIDQTQQTGAYMGGSGAYNPNPFASGSYKSQNPWGGF